MKPHKHAELIKAWADGAEIECKENFTDWQQCENPDWGKSYLYFRIKQEQSECEKLFKKALIDLKGRTMTKKEEELFKILSSYQQRY